MDTGGAPKVTQCIRLKHPVKILSSDSASFFVDSMCEYSKDATAPPAECPVIRREYVDRSGNSSIRCRSLAATGPIILRAIVRNPVWHAFSTSSCHLVRTSSFLEAEKNNIHQESLWPRWGRVEISYPIHKCLCTPNCKDDYVHIVHRDRLDNHRFGTCFPISSNMCTSLFAGGFFIRLF